MGDDPAGRRPPVDLDAVQQAIHPAYRGWVEGRQTTHDRDAAVRSISDAPPVHDYALEPLERFILDEVCTRFLEGPVEEQTIPK